MVKLFGLSFLDGVSILEVFIVLILWTPVGSGFHGDDGPRTTQLVLLLDGDAGPFHNTANGSIGRFVTFSVPTA